MRTGILACEALSMELKHILMTRNEPIEARFLPAKLDMYPSKLHRLLDAKLSDMSREFDRVIVGYGRCCLLIDDLIEKHRARKIKGVNCYEILAGKKLMLQIEEVAKVYFLTPFQCWNFKRIVKQGFGDLATMNKQLSGIDRLVYLDTGIDDSLILKARKIGKSLHMPLEILHVGLDSLEESLEEAMATR